MAHSRQTIREGVATLLTGLVRTANRVYAARVRPVPGEEMPALCIYTLAETSERTAMKPTLTRTLDLIVAVYAEGPDGDLAVDLDDVAAEVEARMGAAKNLGIAGVTDATLVKTDVQITGGAESEKLSGILALTYRVAYRTSPANAEAMV
jgi:hypothetical protein